MEDVELLLQKLSLDDKIRLISGTVNGNGRGFQKLKIPVMHTAEAFSGLRKPVPSKLRKAQGVLYPAICYPSPACLGNSWDRTLMSHIGRQIGLEAKSQKLDLVMVPGPNVKRSPLSGRNFSYYGEDPVLNGNLAANFVLGIQSARVGAVLSNFVLDQQEGDRWTLDAIVDDRALNEIYLRPFEIAIHQSRPLGIKTAYHMLNNQPLPSAKNLLTELLRVRWGFSGLVLADSSAIANRPASIMAGCDFEVGNTQGYSEKTVREAVRDRTLYKDYVNEAARRYLNIIRILQNASVDDESFVPMTGHQMAQTALESSAVLLKNDDKVLPLDLDDALAIVGRYATSPRIQAGGIYDVRPRKVENFIDILKTHRIVHEFVNGFSMERSASGASQTEEARVIARRNNKVILFLGCGESFEQAGKDRSDLRLPTNQEEIIEELAKENPNIIVVLTSGSVVEMPWINSVKAVLQLNYAGEAAGAATYRLLYGKVNPSGRLAETYPFKASDAPTKDSFPMGPKSVTYLESLYVGYRYYDAAQKAVLFPFGYGLSYTTFEYSNLLLENTTLAENESLSLAITITNTGEVDGHETIQLYLEALTSVNYHPKRELKDFAKVFVKAKQSKTVLFDLPYAVFATYDDSLKRFVVEGGSFKVVLAEHSRAQGISETITVAGTKGVNRITSLPEYYDLSERGFSREAFKKLTMTPIADNVADRPGQFTMETPMKEVRKSTFGKTVYRWMQQQAARDLDLTHDAQTNLRYVQRIVDEMPLRAAITLTHGRYGIALCNKMLDAVNGRGGALSIYWRMFVQFLFSPFAKK
ncbi:MAG: glycoside hydrolase family 3 C-terminal domain-containing protein [Erysipelotrichaceae bacterium]|jgi:beta-glucosidase|nr:glycoside hydrolase family 3 C-terminal domain-containing protein [Erysipelotrichaceae bacterium]